MNKRAAKKIAVDLIKNSKEVLEVKVRTIEAIKTLDGHSVGGKKVLEIVVREA